MGWPLLLLLSLAGCDRPDPELVARRDALLHWEQGVQALEAGQADRARQSFAEARQLQPEHLSLAVWEAAAIAEQGDLQAAVDLLEGLLLADPSQGEARYNRAAYLARMQRPAEAAAELEQALELGVVAPGDVWEDEDFAPWRDHPAFGIVPASPLSVAVELSSDTVFLGSDLRLRLRIAGAAGPHISITPEQAQGPLQLVSVVEDVVPSTHGPVHDLSYTFRVLGAGEVLIGPLHIWAGEARIRLEPVRARALAPPDHRLERELRPPVLKTPREIGARAASPSVRRISWSAGGAKLGADGEEALAVKLSPGDRVRLGPEVEPEPHRVRYELREAGTPQWVLWLYPKASPEQLEVVRQGRTLLELDEEALSAL